MLRVLCGLALLLGCAATESKPPPPPRVLGGASIDGRTLLRGERGYRSVCASCHGLAGDGNGRLGVRQHPRPRSFKQGVIKFSSAPAGELWRDEDVMWILKNGLTGTQMLPIKLPDSDLLAITHYIKTFSPRWQSESAGERVPIPAEPDPPPDLNVGAALFAERCSNCHNQRKSVATVWDEPAVAPDLRTHLLKTGTGKTRLYRTLAAGIGGIEGHEGLAGSLQPFEIWSLVHHVQALSSR